MVQTRWDLLLSCIRGLMHIFSTLSRHSSESRSEIGGSSTGLHEKPVSVVSDFECVFLAAMPSCVVVYVGHECL